LQALFNQTIEVGDSLSGVVLSASDADTSVVSLSLTDGPSWMGVTETGSGTGTVTGAITGVADAAGVHTVTIRATANGLIDEESFTLTVNPPANSPPEISAQSLLIGALAVNGDSAGNVAATDPNVGDTLTFTELAGGTGAAIFSVASDGEVTVTDDSTLDFDTTPYYTLNVEVSDGEFTDSAVVTISSSIVFDDFSSTGTVGMVGTTPPVAPDGVTWQKSTDRGEWEIQSNVAVETSTFDFGIFDRRIVVDAGVADAEVSADITVNSESWVTFWGRTMNPRSGVVARSNDNGSQWVMWYFDGVSTMVAGSTSGELHRMNINWQTGETRNLAIEVVGSTYKFKIDGVVVATKTFSNWSGNHKFGLFSAEQDTANAHTYDNFSVIPLN